MRHVLRVRAHGVFRCSSRRLRVEGDAVRGKRVRNNVARGERRFELIIGAGSELLRRGEDHCVVLELLFEQDLNSRFWGDGEDRCARQKRAQCRLDVVEKSPRNAFGKDRDSEPHSDAGQHVDATSHGLDQPVERAFRKELENAADVVHPRTHVLDVIPRHVHRDVSVVGARKKKRRLVSVSEEECGCFSETHWR